MATVRELILAASTLPAGAKHREHLQNLNNGGGEGLPFPVPVTIVSVENVSIAEARSVQITNQNAVDGIDSQVVSEQVDINTGNSGL